MTDEQIVALVEAAEVKMLERMERVETNLLKEFRKSAVRIEARGKVSEITLTGFNERLNMLEERMDSLENRGGEL